MSRPLRLMIYDPTCRRQLVSFAGRSRVLPLGLSHAWRAGGLLYQGLRRLDRVQPVEDWPQALAWLVQTAHSTARPIQEVQFWGHGKWGAAQIDGASLDARALQPASPLYAPLCALREHLAGPESLVWFRTCETFGAQRGHDFARRLSDFLGCRTAGHTYVIGPWQSGLHSLGPGEQPYWAADEGLERGTADAPVRARMSARREPYTINCLRGDVPVGW